MDIRDRAMATLDAGETVREVAEALSVAPSSDVKWSQRLRSTGGAAPGKIGGHVRHKINGADAAWLRTAFQLALARAPKPAEQKSLGAFLATQRDYYRANPADAEKLLRIGLSPPTTGDAIELAAWTSLARVLLNSQEVITRY